MNLRKARTNDLTCWIKLIGCPYCYGVLDLIESDRLHCPQDLRTFVFKNNILILTRKDKVEEYEDFGRAYCKQRLKQGWKPLTRNQALKVPFVSPKGYPRVYWEIQKHGYLQLLDFLKEVEILPDRGPVADFGAGSSWLSYRFALAGYQVIALDKNLDKNFGLGVVEVYLDLVKNRLLPVQGNFENPPLLENKFSIILFNASLHFTSNLVKTLACAKRLLKTDGYIIILNSPVIPRKYKNDFQENYQFDREELQYSIKVAGLQQQWINIKFGIYWKIHLIISV
ncbi:MAG: class I SAM-dependent methyltransferase [Promethearchaeota archaeon]|jgi:SAM-dependent methyltransferase